jgi:YggT family protein
MGRPSWRPDARDEGLRGRYDVNSLIAAIQLISFALSLAVLADILVSFFLNPYHPIRRALDSFVGPMLAPIRRILPPVGMFDFSPVVLILLIQLIQELAVRVLLSLT